MCVLSEIMGRNVHSIRVLLSRFLARNLCNKAEINSRDSSGSMDKDLVVQYGGLW